jgi:hypothetical protein
MCDGMYVAQIINYGSVIFVISLEVPKVRSAGKKICKTLKILFSFLFEGCVPTINFDVQIVYHFVDENFLWPTQWHVVKMMESVVVF